MVRLATAQYVSRAMAPVIPPVAMDRRVPNLSALSPGRKLNNPATKKAVLMVSTSDAVRDRDFLRSFPYKPKAYVVPPVVSDALNAATKLGMLERRLAVRGGRLSSVVVSTPLLSRLPLLPLLPWLPLLRSDMMACGAFAATTRCDAMRCVCTALRQLSYSKRTSKKNQERGSNPASMKVGRRVVGRCGTDPAVVQRRMVRVTAALLLANRPVGALAGGVGVCCGGYCTAAGPPRRAAQRSSSWCWFVAAMREHSFLHDRAC